MTERPPTPRAGTPAASTNVVPLSRFRADVARSLARRAKRLLEAADLPQQVAALAPLETYFIIKEVGVESATPILLCTRREQLQACIDLDCWQGDVPLPEEIDVWLAPFAAVGPEALARAFLSLDEELQIGFLASSLTIYDNREDEDIPDPPQRTVRRTTPDTFFQVEVPAELDRDVDPLVLVDALYKAGLERAFTLLTAARWELPSPLQEEALRFRNARLEDLGFPPPAEAAQIFAAPRPVTPPRAAVSGPVATGLPALYAEPLENTCLLSRALGHVDATSRLQELERQLVYLVNSAVIAYGEQARDLSHTREVANRVRDTVSLGLEQLLSPDAPHPDLAADATARAAGELLTTYPLVELFRIGHAQVVQLQRSTAAVAADPVIAHWLDTTETAATDYGQDRLDRELVRALLLPHPLYSGYNATRPTARRAFAEKRELADAAGRVDAIAGRLG